MLRKIIRIDEEKCNGCGACARACHEGAIAMVDGKARLMREDYCDGLGDCLPACPTGAISFETREAAAYDEAAVKAAKAAAPHACPGSRLATFARAARPAGADNVPSNFHADFIRGRVALVGCPKLDAVDYAEKLSQIFAANDIRSITVARMEVPCCGGLESAVRRALAMSGKQIPLAVRVIATNGELLEGGC